MELKHLSPVWCLIVEWFYPIKSYWTNVLEVSQYIPACIRLIYRLPAKKQLASPIISSVLSCSIPCLSHKTNYCTSPVIFPIIEGSLEVKLPTIWTDEKQSRAEAERRERLEERRSEKRKSQKKEDADARKGRKVAKHCVFPMICGSGGSKSRLAKAAGAEPAGHRSDEKLHAVVARSTFRSQKC